MKKIMTYFIILLVVMLPVLGVDAAKKKKTTTTTTQVAGEKVNFYIFYGSTCGYCQRLHEYVAELEKDPTINYMFNVVDYEVWGDAENNRLMTEVAKEMNHKVNGVPIYVIGEQIFGGYSAETHNDSIRKAIEDAYKNTDTKDMVEPIAKEILSGDRAASESSKNRTVGFIILGVTAIVVIAILFSKNNTTYYEDDDDDDDDEVEEEKVEDNKKEVKKTTTKSTTTKKTTNTKKKN